MPRTIGGGRRWEPRRSCRWPRGRALRVRRSSTCGREQCPISRGSAATSRWWQRPRSSGSRGSRATRDGRKHTRLLSAANSPFRQDYQGEDEQGQQVPIMTVFKRWPDGMIRLHWASELLFEPTDPGQDMRHLGTVEPLWTLFDLTPGGRPDANEEIEYDCCHSNGRSA